MVRDVREEPVGAGEVEHRGHDVFVSYSRADRDVVVALTGRLSVAGKKAWVDLEDIPPSAEWMSEIRGAIDAADGYLVMVSPDLARSKVCSEELEHALGGGKRVVPVMVRDTDPESVPVVLSRLNWIDASQGDLEVACDRIVEALDTDLPRVKAHTRLLVRASEWAGSGEDRSALLRGSELADSERLIADPDREPEPTQLQTRFVLASRKAAGRRQRALFAGTAVALVVALILGSVAFVQRQEAARQRAQAIDQRDLARSGDLSSSALAALQSDEELGLLLALEAARIRRTDRVESALRDALNASDVELVFDAHEDKIGDVVFGPGGDTIASAGADFTILIWDSHSGAVLQTIQADQPLTMLAFDPNGRWIAAGTPDDGVVLWDPNDGELVRRLPIPRVVYEVRFSPHGDMLIAGGDGGTRVWRTSTLEPVLTIPPGPRVTYGAHVTDAGDRVVTANADGTVKMFDGHSGNLIRTLGTLDDLAFTVEFDARGDRVLGVAEDRTVRVWDATSGEQLNVLPHDTLISDASWVGMDYIVSLESDGVGLVWDLSSGAVVSELRGHTGYSSALAVSPQGDRIATGSDDGTVRIWRPVKGWAT